MKRTVDVKFEALKDGAFYKDIYPVSAPSLRMDESGEIKTSLSGEFILDIDLNWLTDRIRPVLLINGQRHELGIFLPATVLPSKSDTRETVSIEAYDLCWQVKDTKAERPVFFAAGTNYIAAVKELLTVAGIALVQAVPTAATLPEAREGWEVGTSYLSIINELLSEINYNPLWFSPMGMAVLEPASVPSAEKIDHTLDNSNIESLLLPNLKQETDIFSAPNVFICLVSNPDKDGPMVAIAENTNPQSPLSIMRRGRRIAQTYRLNNIASQEELEAYAARLRNESMFTGEIISVETALLPGYGVADVTALHYDDINSVCIERGWEMELQTGGTMRHTLERVVYNLG